MIEEAKTLINSLVKNKKELQFKDVFFYVKSNSEEYGRNIQVTSLIKREQPYTNNLSKKANRYEFDCFILGDNIQEQKKKIIEACTNNEKGILKTNLIDEIVVWCESLKFNRENELNFLSFSISFVEAGDKQPILISTVSNNYKSILKELNDKLDELISIAKIPLIIMEALMNTVDEAFDLIKKTISLAVVGIDNLAFLNYSVNRLQFQIKTSQNKFIDTLKYFKKTADELTRQLVVKDYDLKNTVLNSMSENVKMSFAKLDHKIIDSDDKQSVQNLSNIIQLQIKLVQVDQYFEELAFNDDDIIEPESVEDNIQNEIYINKMKYSSYNLNRVNDMIYTLKNISDISEPIILRNINKLVIALDETKRLIKQPKQIDNHLNIPEIVFYYEAKGDLDRFRNYILFNQIDNLFENQEGRRIEL